MLQPSPPPSNMIEENTTQYCTSEPLNGYKIYSPPILSLLQIQVLRNEILKNNFHNLIAKMQVSEQFWFEPYIQI